MAGGDVELVRAVAGERAKDLVRDGRFDEAAAQAAALLEMTTPRELLTRASALSALGRAVCWRFDPDGRRDEAALEEADEHLAEAMEIYERLGMRAASAMLVLYRAMWIDFARGRLGGCARPDERGPRPRGGPPAGTGRSSSPTRARSSSSWG